MPSVPPTPGRRVTAPRWRVGRRAENRSHPLTHEEYRTRQLACQAAWKRANPEKVAAQAHRRRARVHGAEGSYTAEEWSVLCDRYGRRCLRCGSDAQLTVDHVIPLSKGGSNSIDNIQPLCGSCNKSKGDKFVDYRISFAT